MNLNKKPKSNKTFTWSFSKWKYFHECKRKYLMMTYKKQFKVPDQVGDSYHMDRGIDLHKKGEYYVKGKIKGLPKEFRDFKKEFEALRKQSAIAEEDWWFDRNWDRIKKFDWDNVWLIVKVDAHVLVDRKKRLRIVDYKTGKEYASHSLQAEVYAVGGWSIYKTIEEVRSEFWYLDQNLSTPYFFYPGNTNIDLDNLKWKWTENAIIMEDTVDFEPTPEYWACKYCNANHQFGGPCQDAINERN